MKGLCFCLSVAKLFLLTGSPKKRVQKLRACLPLVGHNKSKKLWMLILVPSPVNPLYVCLSCGFNMERAEKSWSLSFPYRLVWYWAWCFLPKSRWFPVVLPEVLCKDTSSCSSTHSCIHQIFIECLFCAWCQSTMGSRYSRWKPYTFSHIPIYVLLMTIPTSLGFQKSWYSRTF